MKIAFVYDAVYPWVKGGAEKRIYEIGTRLAVRGDEVHIFGIKWWDGDDVIEYDGMVLHGVCAARKLYANGRRSIFEALVFSLKLVKHMCREKFDVIDVSVFPYFSCFSMKFVSIFRRTPVVFTWHEVWDDHWYEYMGRLGLFGKLIERMVFVLSSNIVVVSEMTKKDLQSFGLDGKNIRLLPNALDQKKISTVAPSDEACDVLFVGRLIREKNVDVLLEAVALVREDVPDIKCCIIGNGPEKEQLVGLAKFYGLTYDSNVRFFDFMEYNEMIARMKSSKVLVLPSSREGFGMVVIEAFACGVPVVTVAEAHNAAAELVEEIYGFVVELDAHAVAGAVGKLLEDAELRYRMGKAAEKAGQGYEWNGIVHELRELYGELI